MTGLTDDRPADTTPFDACVCADLGVVVRAGETHSIRLFRLVTFVVLFGPPRTSAGLTDRLNSRSGRRTERRSPEHLVTVSVFVSDLVIDDDVFVSRIEKAHNEPSEAAGTAHGTGRFASIWKTDELTPRRRQSAPSSVMRPDTVDQLSWYE